MPEIHLGADAVCEGAGEPSSEFALWGEMFSRLFESQKLCPGFWSRDYCYMGVAYMYLVRPLIYQLIAGPTCLKVTERELAHLDRYVQDQ